MTVDYCHCRHARQVHAPADGSICRGLCAYYGHTTDDHQGPCTARCRCDGYTHKENR